MIQGENILLAILYISNFTTLRFMLLFQFSQHEYKLSN